MAKKTGRPTQSLAGLRAKAGEAAEAFGLLLLDVAIVHENTGYVLRFTIDSDSEEGVSLDDCERYHRSILKLTDDIDYDYMEVTSPGADRPLKTERDFRKALGSGVQVGFYRPYRGVKTLTGVLTDFDEESVTLTLAEEELVVLRKEIAIIRLTLDEEELSSPLFEELEKNADVQGAADGNGGDQP